MKEVTITTNKISSLSDHAWQIWPGWEVPVYLFLGGLTAGIMIISALMIIRGNEKKYPTATNQLILGAPILISLGMLALFIHLGHKLSVWAFFITFRPTSPISWGAWILVLVYPVTILMILGKLKAGYPKAYEYIENRIKKSSLNKYIKYYHKVVEFSEKHIKTLAAIALPVGLGLGVYTGVFLSTFVARPFWNSAILGPLFLVSGSSTAAALAILYAKKQEEKKYFTGIDLGLIITELVIFALFIIGMLTSSQANSEAINIILGGPLTAWFWILIIFMGLVLPAFLEILELNGKHLPSYLSPVLVLAGGLILRFVILQGAFMARNIHIKELM